MSEKWKRTFACKFRLEALERLDKSESVLSVGNDFKVGKSTVYDWC